MDGQCCYNFFLNCQEINFSRQARDAKTLVCLYSRHAASSVGRVHFCMGANEISERWGRKEEESRKSSVYVL